MCWWSSAAYQCCYITCRRQMLTSSLRPLCGGDARGSLVHFSKVSADFKCVNALLLLSRCLCAWKKLWTFWCCCLFFDLLAANVCLYCMWLLIIMYGTWDYFSFGCCLSCALWYFHVVDLPAVEIWFEGYRLNGFWSRFMMLFLGFNCIIKHLKVPLLLLMQLCMLQDRFVEETSFLFALYSLLLLSVS